MSASSQRKAAPAKKKNKAVIAPPTRASKRLAEQKETLSAGNPEQRILRAADLDTMHPARALQTINDNANIIKAATSSILSSTTSEDSESLLSILQQIESSTNTISTLSCKLLYSGDHGKFVKFQQLPTELRLKIWDDALPGKRIIEVFYLRLSGGLKRQHTPPHALMHVCHESREVALKRFPVSIGDHKFRKLCIPFNPVLDTLFFPRSVGDNQPGTTKLQMGIKGGFPWSQESKELVKKLAIDCSVWYENEADVRFHKLPNLIDLLVIMHPHSYGEFADVCYNPRTAHAKDVEFDVPDTDGFEEDYLGEDISGNLYEQGVSEEEVDIFMDKLGFVELIRGNQPCCHRVDVSDLCSEDFPDEYDLCPGCGVYH